MTRTETWCWIFSLSIFAVEANEALGFDGFWGPCVIISALLCGLCGVATKSRGQP